MMNALSEPAVVGNHLDRTYDTFVERINKRFLANCANGKNPLFLTDAKGLWELYLDNFPDPIIRQHHNCNACRKFIERFGALAVIDDDGRVIPAIWHEDDAPESYRQAIAAMAKAVRRAKVTGVFISSDPVWGTPETGDWHHLAVRPNPRTIFERATRTAGQAMAEKQQDFIAVMRALDEFSMPHVETALTLLRADALYRSEKVLGQAVWLHGLHVARSARSGAGKANVVWRAVASAPAGFCHPRSSMIGTLLEDIAAGKDFDSVSRAFAEKMHPLAYLRPQAFPKPGAIAEAEKIVPQLGAAGSLARRFARVDEIQALWRPAPHHAEPSDSIFGHLKSKANEAIPAARIPPTTMTWEKFYRTAIPSAERIEIYVPIHGNYAVLVTAVHKDSPPILQWDREDARNPVSWYVWNGGSPAIQFGLCGGRFYDVAAISLKPSMWNGGGEHHGKGVIFVIDGARESRIAGAALFPEILKTEFHGVRSVIEAYSRGATIEGKDEPHSVGVMLDARRESQWDALVRVWSSGRSLDYRIDRWD